MVWTQRLEERSSAFAGDRTISRKAEKEQYQFVGYLPVHFGGIMIQMSVNISNLHTVSNRFIKLSYFHESLSFSHKSSFFYN